MTHPGHVDPIVKIRYSYDMVDLSSLLSPDENNKGPSFKKMLLTQISKLKDSNDPLDQQLRSYLLSIIKDKDYSEDSWIAELEEVEQIHRLVKSGTSLSSAVDIVAKTSKRSKSVLLEKYAEYKDELVNIEQIFQE